MKPLIQSYKQESDSSPSSSFAVYISMEHPAPASKAIFESGWVKLFSVGIKEKALLTHGEQSGTFSTLPLSFLSQSSYSRA